MNEYSFAFCASLLDFHTGPIYGYFHDFGNLLSRS